MHICHQGKIRVVAHISRAKEEHDHKVAMIVPGTILEGTVETLQPYGAFVDLKDGLSGLVHISQISQRRIKKPSEVLKVGDKVKVKVLNTNDGKISLSMKAVEDQQTEEMEHIDTAQYGSGESVGTSLGVPGTIIATLWSCSSFAFSRKISRAESTSFSFS